MRHNYIGNLLATLWRARLIDDDLFEELLGKIQDIEQQQEIILSRSRGGM